jgi:photosystem II stability/assembly factor-like uncharacterized protein
MKKRSVSYALFLVALFLAGSLLLKRHKHPGPLTNENASEGSQAGVVLASPGEGLWEPVSGLGPVGNLLALRFSPDGNDGVALGSHGELVVTRDGGETWETRRGVTLGELVVATCLTMPRSGAVVFGTAVDEDWPAGTIYELSLADGGQRKIWQGEFGGLLTASADGRYWAGENCFVLRSEGGRFIPMRLPSCDGEVIYDIESMDNRVLAVGMNGLAAVSRDAGNTWQASRLKLSPALGTEPLEIHRVSVGGQLALAGGNYGGLWRSEDAGRTWTPVRGLGRSMNVWALYLEPSTRAGFVGGGDSNGAAPFILATNDGGRTLESEPVRGARGRIMAIGRGRAGIFAVTFDGRVLVRRDAF